MNTVLTRERILHILEEELPYLCREYGVERLALYGSFAQGTPDEDSDVDLLVELNRPLGLDFVALADHLEERLGCRVDLATFETLKLSLNHPRYRPVAENIQRTLADVRAAAG